VAIGVATHAALTPDLVEQAQAGDSDALEQVINSLARDLLPLATALAGPAGSPDVLLGDALSRVYERIHQVRSSAALLSWARRILVRLYLDDKRRHGRHQIVRLETVTIPSPSADLGAIDLRQALDRLPRDRRSLLVLHYWLGLTLAETATTLGLREGTVKSRLHETLRSLRGELGP
jgi:RNA polymerase sigma factor (sigma-70 family)